MRKKLHPVVLTVGICQVVFGLLGMCCGGFGVIGAVAMLSKQPVPGVTQPAAGSKTSPTPNTMEVQERLVQRVPSYLYEQTAEAFASLFVGFLMIVSGLGLFFMQSWARWLAICYAVFSILRNVIVLLYSLIFVLPAMVAISDEIAASGNAQAAGTATGFKIG